MVFTQGPNQWASVLLGYFTCDIFVVLFHKSFHVIVLALSGQLYDVYGVVIDNKMVLPEVIFCS